MLKHVAACMALMMMMAQSSAAFVVVDDECSGMSPLQCCQVKPWLPRCQGPGVIPPFIQPVQLPSCYWSADVQGYPLPDFSGNPNAYHDGLCAL